MNLLSLLVALLAVLLWSCESRKINYNFPIELLLPVTGQSFHGNATNDKLLCFGNRGTMTSLTHSLNHSLTHSYSLTHSLTLIRSLIHSLLLTHSLTYSLLLTLTHSYSLTHSLLLTHSLRYNDFIDCTLTYYSLILSLIRLCHTNHTIGIFLFNWYLISVIIRFCLPAMEAVSQHIQ
jgi:hypothetical protein